MASAFVAVNILYVANSDYLSKSAIRASQKSICHMVNIPFVFLSIAQVQLSVKRENHLTLPKVALRENSKGSIMSVKL